MGRLVVGGSEWTASDAAEAGDCPRLAPVVDLPADHRDLDMSVYRAVFEHSLDGLLFSVPDGRILAANEAACGLLGMTEDEIIAAGRDGIIDKTDRGWGDALDERQRVGRARARLRARRGDGTVFLADIASVIFQTEAGPRACVLFRQATDGAPLSENLFPAEKDADPVAVLTAREHTVIAYLATRMTYREIAAAMYISSNTVKSHVRSIYRKLNASSRSAAVAAVAAATSRSSLA